EEVHLARAAELVGGPGQLVLADQGVDQARLADVGTAGEGHLRQVRRRQLLNLGAADHELGPAREHDARLFDEVLVENAHPETLYSLPCSFAIRPSMGFSVLCRRMMMYCWPMVSRLDQAQ